MKSLRTHALGWFAAATMLLSNPAAAESEYWVSIASYADSERAQEALTEVSSRLSETLAVVGVATASGYFYRLAAGPYASRDLAEAGATSARAAGFVDAWVFREAGEALSPLFTSVDSGLGGLDDVDLDALDRSLGIDPSDYPSQDPDAESDAFIDREVPSLVDEAPADFKLNRLHRED